MSTTPNTPDPNQIPATQVRELRDKTGAPMMDCKRALTEAKGNMDKAVELLRVRGVAVAGKKGAEVAREGYRAEVDAGGVDEADIRLTVAAGVRAA